MPIDPRKYIMNLATSKRIRTMARKFFNGSHAMTPEWKPNLRRIAATTIILVFLTRCVHNAWRWSITWDENIYLTHGIHFWHTGDDLDLWALGVPRLPHLVNALPAYLASKLAGRFRGIDDPTSLILAISRSVSAGERSLLFPARCMAMTWGILLLLLVYRATTAVSGRMAGLVTTLLLSCIPEILAHSSIAGVDMPAAATAIGAVLALAACSRQFTDRGWLMASIAIGLSWAVRHSAILLLPVAFAISFRHAFLTRGLPRTSFASRLIWSAARCIECGAIAFLTVWMSDGLRWASPSLMSTRALEAGYIQLATLLLHLPFALPTSVASTIWQLAHQAGGHEGYFCGQLSDQGWWSYFPVAFLIKTPTGLLILMIVATARARGASGREVICMATLAVTWIALITSHVNIGLRYALTTYPLVMIPTSRIFARDAMRDRFWGPVVVAAALWLMAASVGAHGRYLSYFNELCGGPSAGHLYLADSNIDWGQDRFNLEDGLRRHNINPNNVSIYMFGIDWEWESNYLAPVLRSMGLSGIQAYQITKYRNGEGTRRFENEKRFVAISVNRLLGLYGWGQLSGLKSQRLVGRISDSVFIIDRRFPAAPDNSL